MTELDEQGRPEPPVDGDELATLQGFLEFLRATFAWKISGLDANGLNATLGSSQMTLGGMAKHLAYVEDDWFRATLLGEPRQPIWAAADWKSDRDWEWHSARRDTPEELLALWQDAVERSRAAVAQAMAGGGLDQPARNGWPDGRSPSLRWILVHLIEEYARHNGHADLIRESIDGATGE